MYFPYYTPRDIIEKEVLLNMRLANEATENEKVSRSISKGKKKTQRKASMFSATSGKSNKISIFRETAITNLKQYMFNYNEYIFFFKNYSEFMSSLNLKDFRNHFRLYLTGSCFHFNDLRSKQCDTNNVKFDIFKDLLEFNKQEMLESLSYTQKVLLVACFLGCVLSPERIMKIFGTEKAANLIRNGRTSRNEVSLNQNIIEKKYVSFQTAIAIYYNLIDKQKQCGYLKVSFNKNKTFYRDIYVVDKHVDFMIDINSLDKMKLIKILKIDDIAYNERTICIIADVELISEIGLSINIPLSEYV